MQLDQELLGYFFYRDVAEYNIDLLIVTGIECCRSKKSIFSIISFLLSKKGYSS